jgi:hypothetical protein
MYTTEDSMATTRSLRHKHVRIDQAKLSKARKILGAATDTETLDRALSLVVGERRIDETLHAVKGKGSLAKLFP